MEKLREEESEDNEEEYSKEEIKQKKSRRDTIRLLKIRKDVIKEEDRESV